MTTRRLSHVLIAALLALGASAGCRQVLDLHNRTEAAPDGGDAVLATPVAGRCGGLYPTADCAKCMGGTECCAAATECSADTDCAPTADCFFACADDDSSCRGRCTYLYRWSQLFTTLVACRARSCSRECGLRCGGISYTATRCEQCIEASCCTAAQECAANPSCLDQDTCNSNDCMSGLAECTYACAQAHPDGGTVFDHWDHCVRTTCAGACRGGDSWECLDSRTYWPTPAGSQEIEFSVGLVDLGTEQPYVGTIVKACSAGDIGCGSPLRSSKTDDQGRALTDDRGRVTVRVLPGTIGFNGYLELSGGTLGGADAGAAIYPALWYIVPPYVSGGWKGNLQFLSAEGLPYMASYMHIDLDPTKGHIAVDTLDCDYKPAPGVSLVIEGDPGNAAHSFYFQGTLPDVNAAQTDGLTAIGGFVNVTPGLITLKATRVDGARPIGSMKLQIRPGTITAATFPPILQ
jgi:hypothetical protein